VEPSRENQNLVCEQQRSLQASETEITCMRSVARLTSLDLPTITGASNVASTLLVECSCEASSVCRCALLLLAVVAPDVTLRRLQGFGVFLSSVLIASRGSLRGGGIEPHIAAASVASSSVASAPHIPMARMPRVFASSYLTRRVSGSSYHLRKIQRSVRSVPDNGGRELLTSGACCRPTPPS
jgi:hypothetical protein